jgi:predicted nucleic acid-binding protein
MIVIANTTIISNFAAVRRLDVLRNLLGQVYISTDVYAEIQDGLAQGCNFYADIDTHIYPFTPDGWLRLTALEGDEELRLFSQLPVALHRGEASSLAIAAHRGWAFLSDDARARRTAQELGLILSGTLGALIQAIEAKLLTLDQANVLLAEMIRAGYHSPYNNLSELLSA